MKLSHAFGDGGSLGHPPVAANPAPGAFMVWPLAWWPVAGEAIDLYSLAYEQAAAALRPSWYDRLAAGSWN